MRKTKQNKGSSALFIVLLSHLNSQSDRQLMIKTLNQWTKNRTKDYFKNCILGKEKVEYMSVEWVSKYCVENSKKDNFLIKSKFSDRKL
jgi:hypothetical protein